MTDEQKPGTEPAAIGDDETTRTPVTPPSPAAPPPAVPPMTPAWDPVSADPTGSPAWTPVAPTAPITRPAARRARIRSTRTTSPGPSGSGRREWRRLRAVAAAARALGGRARGRRPRPRCVGGRRRAPHRPRRPDRPSSATSPRTPSMYMRAPARPARRPAPGRRRVPLEVPGLRRPGRARDQARRGPRRSRPRGDRQPADLHRRHQAVVRRRARVQHRAVAAAQRRLKDPAKSIGDVPCPGPASRSRIRPARRRGSTPQLTKAGATSTTETYKGDTIHLSPGVPGHPAGLRDRRRQGRRRSATRPRSRPRSTPTATAASPTSPGRRPRSIRSSGDHVGFAYMALRPLLAWSSSSASRWAPERGAAAAPAVTAADAQAHPGVGRLLARVRERRDRHGGDPPEAGDGRRPDREPVVQRSPSTSRRRAVVAAITNDYGKTPEAGARQLPLRAAFKPMIDQTRPGARPGRRRGCGGRLDRRQRGRRRRRRRHARRRPDRRRRPIRRLPRSCSPRSSGFLALGGAQQGITVTDEDYNGTTITIVDLGDISKLAGDGRLRTSRCSPLPAGHVEIAYAVTDEVVVIGSGPGFVKHVLDTTPATSLAANDDYKKLVDRVGTTTGDDLRRHRRHPRGGREGRQRQTIRPGTRRTRPTSSRSSSHSTR